VSGVPADSPQRVDLIIHTWRGNQDRIQAVAATGPDGTYGKGDVSHQIFICEQCRREVDPEGTDTVIGQELLLTRTMGADDQWIEGLKGYFHSGCTALFGRTIGDKKWVTASDR
jgi:hypothetical protein